MLYCKLVVHIPEAVLVPESEEMASLAVIFEEEAGKLEEVPVVLIQSVPAIKYHQAPLEFLSRSMISQREYERKVIAQGHTRVAKMSSYSVSTDMSRGTILNPNDAAFVANIHYEYLTFIHYRENEDDDDMLSIRCPGAEDGGNATFHMKRSVLMRSPTFAKFFNSEHYLPNCDMLIAFVNDPATCFEIAKRYLEDGPDNFNRNTLRVYISLRSGNGDRIVVLVRLHRLAKNMGLFGLMTMAHAVLTENERFLTPGIINVVTRLIFAIKSNFGRVLKDWCLLHIGRFLIPLSQNEDWPTTLCVCEEEIREEWNKLAAKNDQLISAVEQRATNSDLEGMVKSMSFSAQTHAISTIEGEPVRVKTFEELMIDHLKPEAGSAGDEEWEDVGGRASTDNKRVRQAQLSSLDSLRSIEGETAKARAVMGINAGFDSGAGMASHQKAKGSRFSNGFFRRQK